MGNREGGNHRGTEDRSKGSRGEGARGGNVNRYSSVWGNWDVKIWRSWFVVRLVMAEVSWLVVGYGSLLRSDDGVGQRIAAAVAEWELPGVRSLPRHQLTPELAIALSEVDRALFVDAAIAGTDVEINPLTPDRQASRMGHSLTPARLLGMSQWLYDHCPQAWLMSIPGENFDLGEDLSELVERRMGQVLNRLPGWFRDPTRLVPDVRSELAGDPTGLNLPHSDERSPRREGDRCD
ncbi:hydrogenase maturation protease [Geitlerinema sp. P-1104]|nr:hydrogenase maturation protease [Geitlerinema sp. P-1104]